MTTKTAPKTPRKKATPKGKSKTPDKAPAKEASKPTREQWLAEHPSVKGEDGQEYSAHAGWLTNHEGSQKAQRPKTTPTHQDNPEGWLMATIRKAIEEGGWSSRQLAIATGAVPTKTPSGKTRLVGGVSLGQIATILKGGSCKAETASRLLSVLGYKLTR